MYRIYVVIIALLLSACKYDDEQFFGNHSNNNADVKREEIKPAKARHDFTSISHLYSAPYVTVATPYERTLNVSLIRGDISCDGECNLPLTGYGSAMFNIDTDELLTDITIKSQSRSFICYEMSNGWFVVNYHYQGRSWWVEAQESCYHGTYEIDPSQWEWDTVESAFADVRGFGSWSLEG